MPTEIAAWLGELGLARYAASFEAQDVDLRSLALLNETDLRELGVSLGHRKVILAASARLVRGDGAPAAFQAAPDQTSRTLAERRLVSVLFCDLIDATKLSRQLDPEDMRQLLRSYQDRAAGAVARFGGHLAQYLGDGVMAFFGWPTAYEDQAERAVRAGLEAIASVASLEAVDGGTLCCRVGIATGSVVVGDLSDAGRQEGAIAGETPNLAARLQQCAGPNQLVICEATRRLIGTAFDLSEIGTRHLKGFEEGTRVLRVDGIREIESRFDALRGENLSRFVGRAGEVTKTLEKWELAAAGDGQVVLIAGEAGIGKSRLIRAIDDEIGRSAHARWRLQCSPYHTSSALHPVIHRLGQTLGLSSADTAAQKFDKLETFVLASAHNPALAMPIFAGLLSIDLDGRYAKVSATPQELKSLTLQLLVDHCLAVSSAAPLLLIIEDAHWIDPTTRELVEQTIARIPDARVLVILTHRPDWSVDWTERYPHVTSFSLGRLATPDVAQIVTDIIGPAADDELVREIAARTDGVPMFVEEVARSLVASDTQPGSRDGLVPSTLQGALMSQLDRLDRISREIVQSASVMGRELDVTVIARVCRLTSSEMAAALDELLKVRLIARGSSDRLVIRHALIQDVAYQSLLRARRRHLHRVVALELAESRSDLIDSQPELLAHHHTEAEAFAEALPLWRHAGERALSRYANNEAVLHFERALEVAHNLPSSDDREKERLECELALGRALRAAGRLPDAMATFQRAADLARARNDTAGFISAAMGFDNSEFSTNETTSTSIALLNEALDRLDTAKDSPECCHLLGRMTRAYIMSGQQQLAESYSRQTEAMARRLRDDHVLAEVLIQRFLVPRPGFEPNHLPAMRAQLNELLATAARLDDHDLYGRAFALCFYQSAEVGDRAQMDEFLERQSRWSSERQYALNQWIVRHARALQYILDGDFALAEKYAEQGLEMGRSSQRDHADGVYGMQMFTIRREQGRLAEIAPVIRHLVQESSASAAWRPGFALIACDLGFKDAAAKVFLELAAGGFSFPQDAMRSTTLAYLAEICFALQDRPRAETLYGLLEPYSHMTITTGVATVCYGSAGRYLGQLASVLDAWSEAEQHYETAMELNRSMKALPWLAHTQCDLAGMLRRRGNPADLRRADALASEAWSIGNRLGMVGLLGKISRLRQ
jgi:class 3 adenylate cyclase/tetratricopeptide (TPR) repeat protein/ABC-type transport system involved in cytochrome c biogenesis ATPase subunit